MIDLGPSAVSCEDKTMSTLDCSILRHQAHSFVLTEFLQFLKRLAESFDFQFETRAFPYIFLAQFASTHDCRIPFREIGHINDRAKYLFNWAMNDLRQLYHCHLVPPAVFLICVDKQAFRFQASNLLGRFELKTTTTPICQLELQLRPVKESATECLARINEGVQD